MLLGLEDPDLSNIPWLFVYGSGWFLGPLSDPPLLMTRAGSPEQQQLFGTLVSLLKLSAKGSSVSFYCGALRAGLSVVRAACTGLGG